MRSLLSVLLLAPLWLPGCDDAAPGDRADATVEFDHGRADADAPPAWPQTWRVQAPPGAAPAIEWTADDLVTHLRLLGVAADRGGAPLACDGTDGAVGVITVGGVLPAAPALTDQSWARTSETCGDAIQVHLSGGGLLGQQYAAYALLHDLGVRFFHPEETLIPAEPRWSALLTDRAHTPAYTYRSVSLHLTHPLELGDAYRLGDATKADEVKRYIDWCLRNFASDGSAGLSGTDAEDYGLLRGFPRSAGFSLHNQQQGTSSVYDPDDPRSFEAQVAEAIADRLGPDPAAWPELFSFTFNPSEFTELDDQEVVAQLTFIADHLAAEYPGVKLYTINHGTAGDPTEHYGVRFYDLPRFAPPNLGVKVHTLMFYDLERPAPVYGNDDFTYLYDFMEAEYQTRPLWYFPEAAWWLTFDIAVPLYLPITLEARSRDLARIDHMRAGGLDGHRTFGTGHEWGYWQNEYCSLRMSADPQGYDWRACVADITSPMGAAGVEVAAVIEAMAETQARDFIYAPEVLAYLVGTDPETEAAAAVGVVFHPLPPGPAQIARWSAAQVATWQTEIAPALARIADEQAAWTARLNAVEAQVPAEAASFFREVRDGVQINGLRAAHQLEAYGALVAHRAAALGGAEPELASARLDAALALTEAALEVVRRREQDYRYQPIERAIGGGPTLDTDDNWTVYPYRYLGRTHHGYFYRRVDDLVAEALAVEPPAIDVPDTLLEPGEAFTAQITDPAVEGARVDLGDGTIVVGDRAEHVYAAPGIYTVVVTADDAELAVDVAALAEAVASGEGGPTVLDPPQVQIIAPVLPAVLAGPVSAEHVVVGFPARPGDPVQAGAWTTLPRGPGEGLDAGPGTVVVPVVNGGDGRTLTTLPVLEARLTAPPGAPIRISGQLASAAVVAAVVEVGGFEPTGARQLVAQLLGFTPDTLPEQLPFTVEFPRR